jgi:hypothetical protein
MSNNDSNKPRQPQSIAFCGVLQPKDGHLISAEEIEDVTSRFLDAFSRSRGKEYYMEFGLKAIDRRDEWKVPPEQVAVDPIGEN